MLKCNHRHFMNDVSASFKRILVIMRNSVTSFMLGDDVLSFNVYW